jgi:hypothetical protein
MHTRGGPFAVGPDVTNMCSRQQAEEACRRNLSPQRFSTLVTLYNQERGAGNVVFCSIPIRFGNQPVSQRGMWSRAVVYAQPDVRNVLRIIFVDSHGGVTGFRAIEDIDLVLTLKEQMHAFPAEYNEYGITGSGFAMHIMFELVRLAPRYAEAYVVPGPASALPDF